MKTREQTIAKLHNQEVSVLIVGAGINGIGTFRDLALQGIDVLLVDRDDFCAGASAASSHMLHGGIRYLENGEFRLVREALYERDLLLHNAPHYARPLKTTIPIFKWLSGFSNAPLKFLNLRDKPGERGALVIKIGLIFYDLFTRNHRTMPGHVFRFKRDSLREYPMMNPNIVCTATYYDAWMPSPERICIELVLDTLAEAPHAHALNYMPLVGMEDGAVILRDSLTGEHVRVRPKLVVNAAGPWIDFTNLAMGKQTQFIGGTKGSHLILDHPELYQATNGSEIFFENDDGRIVLIFPFVDGRVMVGTTDIRIDNPDEAFCTDAEIDYMLGMIRKVFPTIHVERSHIVFNFCGVRPLPSSASSYTGQISRDHSIMTTEADNIVPFPILSLVGGKWTTFRAFSEQVTDAVLKRLGRMRRGTTANLPIGGGKLYPRDEQTRARWLDELCRKTGIEKARATVLFERYGTRAEAIAEFIGQDADKPLQHKPDYSMREVLFIAQQEHVVHLDDFILRRSLLAMLGHVNQALLDELASILAKGLGWPIEKQREEVERTLHILATKHGYTLSERAAKPTG